MDAKKSPINTLKFTKKTFTRQFTQANFDEKLDNAMNSTTKTIKHLPRSNSNVILSKLQQTQNFMPRHLLQKNIDAFKLSNTPLSQNANQKIDIVSSLEARNKSENETLNPNALFRGRLLKPQILKSKEDTPLYVVTSLSKNQQRESPQPSPVNVQNSNFQKEGFNTLLSFFNQSSSKSPARIFPEVKRIDFLDIPRTPQQINCTPADLMPEKSMSIPQRVKTEGDTEPVGSSGQANWAYVEQVISDLCVATGTIFSQKALDTELTKIRIKKKAEYWNEVILENSPDIVEILVVDMIELVVKWHTEIDFINGENIAEKLNEYTKEQSPYRNEALHLLVYFHKNRKEEKKLILSKYCFYFAKNVQFNEDLKSEKDVIIFYFLILGLCNVRITLEHEPIRKIKFHLIKERAVNILQGNEAPIKPLLEWITPRFDNHSIVEKTFFNLNNISTISSTYLFNIRNYITSRYSKLSLLTSENSTSKNESVFNKAHVTQRTVVPFIQQLALPKSNLSPMRSLTLTLAMLNTGEASGEASVGRKTPVLKKRTKIVTNAKEKMLRYDEVNSRADLRTPKTPTVPSFFDALSPKASKTATHFFKSEIKNEPTKQNDGELFPKPEILTMKVDKTLKRNSSATPTLRRPKRNLDLKTSQGPGIIALSPWMENTELPVFDQSPVNAKPHNLVLKSLAEDLINEDEEHPSTLRLYLEEKGDKRK